MKIEHLIVQQVRGIRAFDHLFVDDWQDKILDNVLLIGANGSGKTTILNLISSLWKIFGEFLQIESKPTNQRFQLDLPIITKEGFVAAKFVGVNSMSMWVCMGNGSQMSQFLNTQRHSVSVCVGFELAYANRNVGDFWFADPTHPAQSIHTSDRLPADVLKWLRPLNNVLLRNILGKDVTLPNMVYFPSDNRYLQISQYEPKPENDPYKWLYTYRADEIQNGGLQNYLFNLKVFDPDEFDRAIELINHFFANKKIDGFDARTRELMIKTSDDARHPINDLSSGEKQVLLLFLHATQRLRLGSILLIDEPDLHLHPTLALAFVSHLRRYITQKDGQLWLASHSPDLRAIFIPSEKIHLDQISLIATQAQLEDVT